MCISPRSLAGDLARHHWLAGWLAAFALAALGRFHTFLGSLLVASHGGGLGFLALVPWLAAVTAAWRQAGVLGLDKRSLGCLGNLVTAGRCRVLATRTLVAVGCRLMQRNQLILARADQVGA